VTLAPVDRLSVTTVVDNAVDNLRRDEKVAQRFTHVRAGRMPTLRAEHGLGHWVEVRRGHDTFCIAFDWGLTGESYAHNFRELGLDARQIDALALSHGHLDHFGGLGGFLATYRSTVRRGLPFYAGVDHFLPRYQERDGRRVYIGRLDPAELERQDLAVSVVTEAREIAEGVMLSGEVRETVPYETIPPYLRAERDGQIGQDTLIGEQTLIANVRDHGLVVVTSCSHRGIIGICRHATRVAGIAKIHAVIGGFHLSGLDDERITRVVATLREMGIDYLIPQHCTGMEAMVALAQRLGTAVVWSSVGTTFTFGAP
jgi:7,8-dihydropterin-6-yl-methyl-4-(beta-D-ribofuranosyl)aminobenzene 5'-phosphate synthase